MRFFPGNAGRTFLFVLSVSALAVCTVVFAGGDIMEKKDRGNDMKIRISVNNTVLTATMYDNPTARDFVSLLPLTLTLKDYAGTEKISNLPKRLSLKGAPEGSNPSVGDITYYSPWGNLAIFYRDFGYARGLIIMGKLDSDAGVLKECREPCTVTFERIHAE